MLIEQIAALQRPDGLFPSFRLNKYWFYKRKDDNAFITATVLYILGELPLNDSEKAIYDKIKAAALPAFEQFKKVGEPHTYNFYPAGRKNHFNNGYFLKHLSRFKLANDLDDTALISMVNNCSFAEAKLIKELAKMHANGKKTKIENTPEVFRKFCTYSTWFGKNMPIEFDFCVLCNALRFFMKQTSELSREDAGAIEFIKICIKEDYLLKNTVSIAQNYPRFSLCAYHFGRLLNSLDTEMWADVKTKILADIDGQLTKENNVGEIRLLEIAKAKILDRKIETSLKKDAVYERKPFFVAGFLAGYPNKWIKKLAGMRFFQVEWQAEALELALKAEHQRWVL